MTRASTRGLRPAELKDGCYVKPCALLEIEQLWCGHREVWTTSHGRATRDHVMVDGGMAAYRSKQKHRWQPYSLIMLGALIPISEVPGHMCCLRNGCRQHPTRKVTKNEHHHLPRVRPGAEGASVRQSGAGANGKAPIHPAQPVIDRNAISSHRKPRFLLRSLMIEPEAHQRHG